MPFPNQGENHANGISNEKNIVNYLSSHPDCTINKHLEQVNCSSIIEWKHEGGTKQKRDASYQLENGVRMGISIKNHDNGTFDWINTTKGVPECLKQEIVNFKKNACTDMFACPTGPTDTPIPKKGGVREELDNIFSTYLDNLTSTDIIELLSKIYKTEENTNYIIVNDKKTNKLIMFDELNLDTYCNPNHNHNFILKKSYAKTSRQIFIKKDDGVEINTNFRIRLLLNNGVSALLGKSTKNKTSVPCLKIQQDNVDEFINNCVDKVITDY